MPTDLPIRCSCGTLRGVARALSPARGNRVICYCGDCQSFAHFLGRANEILDAHGGTDVFQTSPARLEITHGAERLACMRLTAKGLVRWYAECCNTPIGNTLVTPQVPFVGLIHSCTDASTTGASRDQALGPVRAHVNTSHVKADATGSKIRASGVVPSLLRFARLLLQARMRGDHKASPFFDAMTGQTRAIPRVLSEAELREVERKRDAAQWGARASSA